MYTLGVLKVEDYDTWRAEFDTTEAAARREKAGIRSIQVFRSQDDPNGVAILTEWDSPEDMARFMQSPELKEAQKKSGTISSTGYVPV